MEGQAPARRIVACSFEAVVADFLKWAAAEYRAHPNSYKRIATSLKSATKFFGTMPVARVDEANVESYKVWRSTEHKVRDITISHDLHAFSTFLKYGMKQRWTRDNPIRNVKIPSDADANRIHVVTLAEEKEYFARAAKNRNLFDVARLMRNQGIRHKEDVSLRAHDSACAESKARPALHFVLYDFRRTFAIYMAQAGVDLATLGAILGHNPIRIVKKYVHPTADH